MDLETIKQGIRTLNDGARADLLTWLKREFKTNTERDYITEDELAVLKEVRQFELSGSAPGSADLARRLGINKEALLARVKRLRDHHYGPYLQSTKSSTGSVFYSTMYDQMVRQPATAMMALAFDHNPGSNLNEGHFEKFASERDILDGSHCLQYLVEHRYIEKRGANEFGPGRRLNAEKEYLKWLADIWPVQSLQDRLEVERCKNEILWELWQLEHSPVPDRSKHATESTLIRRAASNSKHSKARQLAAHSVRSLLSDGAVKERPDVDVGAAVYFLNERKDPGHCVVTWTGTAVLLTAFGDNLFSTVELHVVTIEQVVSYAIAHGLSLSQTMDAVDFCEEAGYLERNSEARFWRTERLMSQLTYIRRVAKLHKSFGAHEGSGRRRS